MNLSGKKNERIGVYLAFLGAAMWGLFPVTVQHATQYLPPITFAALSTLFAAPAALLYAALQGNLHELKNKASYTSLLMITLCIVIIPYLLFFTGAQMTSGTNVTMLLLAEVIFTILFTPFIGEKHSPAKWLGGLGVFFGALYILYNGSFDLNRGDLLIILGTITIPLGNFYSKKALNYVSPAIIIFVRFLLGGLFLLAVSRIVEARYAPVALFLANPWIILFNGLFILGLGKVIWYESLRRLDISKAVMIAMTFPVFSLVILVGFLGEHISLFQWIGIGIMGVGVYFSIRRPSVDIHTTKYAPESST